MDPTCTRQESMKPILFCYWDLFQHEKWMPPSPNWDGLPIWRHLKNGHQQSEITLSPITQHHVGAPGHYSLLLIKIAHTFVINGTTLVHDIHELVGKYIMEQCDVDFCYNFLCSNTIYSTIPKQRRRTRSTNSSLNIRHRVSSPQWPYTCR